MNTFTVKDGTQIYYKDWGTGQPIFFHHGWPLSADDWDAQMMFFLERGYRVIAHDRRGHGRSTQTVTGNDIDTYAADVAEITKALDLKNAVHIGHSAGGGEVTRYVARYGKGRVAKAVLISAIPPGLLKSERNPDGLPMEAFDGLRDGTGNHRAQFYQDITMPFYGYNRPGAKITQGIRDNWWRQGRKPRWLELVDLFDFGGEALHTGWLRYFGHLHRRCRCRRFRRSHLNAARHSGIGQRLVERVRRSLC